MLLEMENCLSHIHWIILQYINTEYYTSKQTIIISKHTTTSYYLFKSKFNKRNSIRQHADRRE